VVWCGVVWRGVAWCGVVWCGEEGSEEFVISEDRLKSRSGELRRLITKLECDIFNRLAPPTTGTLGGKLISIFHGLCGALHLQRFICKKGDKLYVKPIVFYFAFHYESGRVTATRFHSTYAARHQEVAYEQLEKELSRDGLIHMTTVIEPTQET
jgi:hypothetical protein